MIAWLRRLFARRTPDPDLDSARVQRAEHATAVTETTHRAAVVARTVVRESHDDQMRSSFSRAGRRLAGR